MATMPYSITDVRYTENIRTVGDTDYITVESASKAEVVRVMERHQHNVDIRGGSFTWTHPVRRGLGWVSVAERINFEIENAPEEKNAV